MVFCKVTFDFYKKNSNGLIARREHTEILNVFGARKCDIMTEDGLQVQERFELLLLVEMGLTPVDVEKFDYYTVDCTEHESPDDFLGEDDEETDEEEDDNAEG